MQIQSTHPGDHLRNFLNVSGYTPSSFALVAGIAPRRVYQILRRDASVTPKLAWVLGVVTNMDADGWLALQASWDDNTMILS
jgi:addiction module HigA family antidote